MKKGLWTLIKVAYAQVIRAALIKAIDNPDSEIDDIVVAALDRLFDYNG